jgi:hypothetical protein
MFSDVVGITSAMKSIIASSNLGVSRAKARKFIAMYPNEATLLFSLLLRIEGFAPPAPLRAVVTTNTDSWEAILGTLIFYTYKKEANKFKYYYSTLPYNWQVIIFLTFSKNILASISNYRLLYEYLPDVYTEEKIVSLVIMPEIVGDHFQLQNVNREHCDISYPFKVYRGAKNFTISRLKYYINYGTRVVSNINQKSVKDAIISKMGQGRYGAIVVPHRIPGYKYKRAVQIVMYGEPEDILALYQGRKYTLGNVTVHKDVKEIATISSDEDMLSFLTTNRIGQHYFIIGDEGISNISLKSEFVHARCIDYITDEEYTPLGVICDYKGVVYRVLFNVLGSDILEGIVGRYIRLQMDMYQGVVIRVSFNSVVKVWSIYGEYCKMCGRSSRVHSTNGVCVSCVTKLRARLATGSISEFDYNGEPFTVVVANYQIVGGNKKVNYTLLEGQGVLPLW